MSGAGLLPPVVAELTANISEFKAKMGEAKAEMGVVESEGKSRFSGLAGAGKAALLGLGAVGVGVGAIAIKAALEGEKSHAALVSAVKNSGVAFKSIEPAVDSLKTKMAGLGYKNDEMEAGLTRLTQATNDPKKAMGEMGLAADVAAARHISLEQAATLVGKVSNGNVAILKRLGLNYAGVAGTAQAVETAHSKLVVAQDKLAAVQEKVSNGSLKGKAAFTALGNASDKVAAAQAKVTAAQGSGASAMDALTKRFGGAAQAQAETYSGKMKAFEATVHNLMETLGQKLLPVLGKVVDWVRQAVDWFGKHKEVTIALAAVVGGALLVAIGAYVAGMVSAAAATLAATWPIILVVAAIALLVAGIIYAYNHWSWFRDAVQAVWTFIKEATSAVVDWFVSTAWPKIKTFLGYIKDGFDAVVGWVKDHWDTIKSATSAVWDFVTGIISAAWDSIASVISGAWDTIKGIYNFFDDLFHGRWSKLWGDVKQIFEGVWDAVLGFFKGLPLKIIGYLGDIGSWLLSKGKDLLEGLWHGIENGAGAVWDWMKKLPGKIKDAVVDAGSWLLDAGKHLLEGLWNGMVNAKDWILGKIKGLMKDVMSGIKSFFGISSPSKLMAEEVGQWIPKGIAKGVAEHTGALLATVSDLSRTVAIDAQVGVTGAIGGAVGGAGTVAPVAAGSVTSNGGHTTVIHLTVQAGIGNPVEIGATVVDALRKYEKANGAGWRAA